MKKIFLAFALCASALCHAAPVTIDFTGLTDGDNPNPLVLSGTTFTTLGGFNQIGQGGICAASTQGSIARCSLNLEVVFGGSASNISFQYFANNTVALGADIGDVEIYRGALLLGTQNVLVVDNSGSTLDLVSLVSFSGVTRIVISSTDAGGVIYDNFRFDRADGSQVPEPAGLALVLTAAGIAAAVTRRRRAGAA